MDRASLVAAAAESTGLDPDLIDASLAAVDEPFALLLDSLAADAALTDAGRAFTARWMARLVGGRAQLTTGAAQDPGVVAEAVRSPVIVAGAPRTGTTFLHGLLAQHRQLRAPEGWELLYPAPPERATTDDDPRIVAADEELTWPQRQREQMRSIHRYAGRMHKECLSAMSFDFRSEEFISRYRVPRYVEWLRSADMTSAYEMHRLVLQTLQRHRPTPRWVLKSPVHLNNLPTVLATYPDAHIVITHRDPAEVLGSVTSLVATLRRAFSDELDEVEIARYHLDLYGRSLDALVDADLPESHVVHIRQRDLIAQPQTELDVLTERFGLPPMVVDTAPPVEAGSHDYSLPGITADEVDAMFARYRQRFLGDEQ